MKQCLNSDGQQFHQNEPSLTSNQTTTSHLKPNNHVSPQTKQPSLTSNQTTSHLKPNNHLSPQTKQPPLTSNQTTTSHLKPNNQLSPQTNKHEKDHNRLSCKLGIQVLAQICGVFQPFFL